MTATRRTGRPPADPIIVQEALRLAALTTPEEAAEVLTGRGFKVSSRSIREWQHGRNAGKQKAPAAPPAQEPAPVDVLALVRRIFAARDPFALAELEAGLVEAAKGEAALVAWLARPLPEDDDDAVDPLEACSRALAVATMHLEKVPPLHPRAASLASAVG
jgi:hypothetical protein